MRWVFSLLGEAIQSLMLLCTLPRGVRWRVTSQTSSFTFNFFSPELQSARDEAVHQNQEENILFKCDIILFPLPLFPEHLEVLQCCGLSSCISYCSDQYSLCSVRSKDIQAAACLHGDLLAEMEITLSNNKKKVIFQHREVLQDQLTSLESSSELIKQLKDTCGHAQKCCFGH